MRISDRAPRDIRQAALQKIAALSASPTKPGPDSEDAEKILAQLEAAASEGVISSMGETQDALHRAADLLSKTKSDQCAILHHLVSIPFSIFTDQSMGLGTSLWLGVVNENPRMEPKMLADIAENWVNTIRRKLGVFSNEISHPDPFYVKAEFAPSDEEALLKQQHAVLHIVAPHTRLLKFFASHLNATRLECPQIQRIFIRLMRITLEGLVQSSNHPLARETYFQIVLFGLNLLKFSTTLDTAASRKLKDQILSAALHWFSFLPRWSFGGNPLQIKVETHLLAEVKRALQSVEHIGLRSTEGFRSLHAKQDLLSLLLENEQARLDVWLLPLDSKTLYKRPNENIISMVLKTAWMESPALALQLVNRFPTEKLAGEVRWLLLNFPERAISEANMLQALLEPTLLGDVSFQLKYLLYWAHVDPISAVTYFLPVYRNHPFILQYAMRTLEHHPVDTTFFYVPQIVQTLRYDSLGYVERYIIETAKFSQLFAHQIIWNMKANTFRDEDSIIPDPVKPTLDAVKERLVESFSPTDRDFYIREFSFFDEITGISGKLKPFIKRTKAEKKKKIEEELHKIKVEVGVYLPSNPEGIVIDIDRKSGKPLQSHAKAPYMATFRIRKSLGEMEGTENLLQQANHGEATESENTIEVWKSAIFKVGDDCRQDVLALQMVAAFRGIFNNVGLNVYVYPYRVTATAPGCGVIDVLPNSISRDMLGREVINGLYDYFIFKYGSEDSLQYQEARNNFVKSMAAYSVISYLLQFKDRHNGNIMIDDAGHILHIDFGFCFDIAPGGIRFERAPFKLTSEMVAVMGGTTDSQPYQWFEELCIKAFLAARQHCEQLAHIVTLMLDSGLPCFKPETVQHLRERFVLEKSEREAADFMAGLVKRSYRSYSTRGYDQFQLLTNKIPY
ncbi:MAG: phosphatidylinositol-4- kinase [Trizodia sp. TS-e1964]|nr:MAG: phosphatidylinositol-4- kinase [Trizodia sp. TS-e1964]